MKKIIFLILLGITTIPAWACPVCERNKPKVLQGITHGSNPESNWDYIIVASIAVLALLTLFYSIKWLIKPNENNNEHIKYLFLNEQ